jgi:hypothetical protein
MNKLFQLSSLFVVMSSALLLSACGQSKVTLARPMGITASNPTSTENFSTQTSAASSSGSLKPVLKYSIEGTGSGGQQIQVYTKKTLKMRFIPGVQNKVDTQTGQTWHYTAISVTLRVGAQKVTLPFLRNALLQPQADASQIIDLSAAVPALCSDSENSAQCYQNVTVVIENPINDDACINLNWTACPASGVPAGHGWNGQLMVQTDLTEGL